MARPKRFELLTPKFVVWCSIQLSYGRVVRIAPETADARASGSEARPERAHSYSLRSAMAREPQNEPLRQSGVTGVA